MKDIHIFGQPIIDQAAIDQLKNCLLEDSIGVLTSDAHKGYSMPVGGCIAYKDHISPSGVGYDIGCGNMAVQTNIHVFDIANDIDKIMDEIYSRISFGMGRPNNEPVDHPVLDEIADIWMNRPELVALAVNQLGTVGTGNHYCDVFHDENGFVWIGVHFGSRGFGHKTACGYLSLAQGGKFEDKPSEGSMDAKPTLIDIHSDLGTDYIGAMELAGKYAYAGRETVVDKVLKILGNPDVTYEVHNHHNFAWREQHFGQDYWVVRKGCTPAFPGQVGFIGANMMDKSVIVEGVDCEEAKLGLYSTVHGAGRILSRTQAAGKKKWIRGEDGKKRPQIVSKGLVDFDEVKQNMYMHSIELRGAGPDEAPECYKSLIQVLEYQLPTIKVLHFLTPIGVAMASAEIFDPYRD